MTGEERKAAARAALDAAGVAYEWVEHPAVFTIEEMDAVTHPHPEAVLKNLFLRDKKGRHVLATLPGHKRANLNALREALGDRFHFAPEEELEEYLGLERGSVTPLGVLNDGERAVEVCFDEEIRAMPLVGVHPNQNTATVYLKPEDLASLIRGHGNPFQWVRL